MNTGTYISGLAHAALIFWALVGGLFLRGDDPLPVATTEVSLVSSEEFAALVLPETAPDVPQEAPAANAAPQPDAAPAPLPRETPPEEIGPQEPPGPPAPPEAPPVPPETPVAPEPAPAEAPRIAPKPAAAPEPEAQIAPEVSPEITPDAAAEAPAEEKPATAPEQATTQIVTEAEKPAAAAPAVSRRPTARPPRPETVQVAQEKPAPAKPETPETADAIAEALAAAVSSEAPRAPAVASGPPLSAGEKDALRVAVQDCWNVGSLSSEALATTVVVAVSMGRDGKPDAGSIRMLSASGGSDAAAKQAYEAARRAIIRCGARGYNLPSDKYDQWQSIEMTFNPEEMRNK